MKSITLTIDGRHVSCPSGTPILEAAESVGIAIPTLCHHPDLKPFGACRICLVEDEKSGRIMASCVTPVTAEMVVRTDSPRVLNYRRNIVRLMMAEHPESCLVCGKGNRCRLREIAAQLGVGDNGLYPMPNVQMLEQANPFITRDLSKCILCGKCIRADHEWVVVGAIDYQSRGFKSRPGTLHDQGLESSACTFCGTCAAICPTGALMEGNTRYVGTPERHSLSICGFCGVGCTLEMGAVADRVVEVHPGNVRGSVNRSTLCVRGHFAHDFLNSPDRLLSPVVCKGGEATPVSWDEALGRAAEGLLRVKERNGPQSVAFLGSSKCSNEENYLFQKIARVLLETNNIDNGGYVSGRSALGVIEERTEGGFRRAPLDSLESSEAILVLGADPNHSVPVMSYHIKRASQKGVPLIVVDPRRTELVDYASLWIRVSPDRDAALIHALAHLLCKRESFDRSFVEQFTEGFSAYRNQLIEMDLDSLFRTAGVDRAVMEQAVKLLHRKRFSIVVGHGLLQQSHGRAGMEALLNLSLMTGSAGTDGTGFYFPIRENNLLGSWDMGAVPDALPGRTPLSDEDSRKGWSRLWQAKISPDQGLNLFRMIEEAEKGNLKALVVMGENPLRTLPDPERVRRALERLDLLVVQDILQTETTRMADIVLAGAAFCEKEGSFTNMEGRIQTFKKVVTPPGEAMPDWEILDRLALKLGYPSRYGSVEKIRAEITRFVPMYGGLNGGGSAWVKQTSRKRLYSKENEGPLLSFAPVSLPQEDSVDQDYPALAILGSHRHHLGSGTRTDCSERMRSFGLKGEVEISPSLAAELGLRGGDPVRIASRSGSILRQVRVQEGLESNLIFLPTGFQSNDVQRLMELAPLGEPHSSSWKTCRVRLEKIG